MIDSVMMFIICLFIIICILHRLDSRENFEIYHPTNYELKPLLPCRQFNRQFNCANEIDDLDNYYSNTCQTPSTSSQCGNNDPAYVMSRSMGRPRICRRLY